MGLGMTVLLIAIVLLAGVLRLQGWVFRKMELLAWNDGVCAKTGRAWKKFCAPLGGQTGYEDGKGNYLWMVPPTARERGEIQFKALSSQPAWKRVLLSRLPDRNYHQNGLLHSYGKYWRGTLYQVGPTCMDPYEPFEMPASPALEE